MGCFCSYKAMRDLESLMVLGKSPRGGGTVGASDGDSSDMDDVEEFFEEHQSGCLDAFAFASTSHILPIIDTARELVMEHDPEPFEDTTIDVEPTQDADGQGPPPTQVLTQCIDELKALLHNIEEGIPSYSDSNILSLVGQVRVN
ncbi:hypothetical protein L7F22_018635 [Adiantum nelumboides]|nr:hypothetical protein [Adiantum nelumboides]